MAVDPEVEDLARECLAAVGPAGDLDAALRVVEAEGAVVQVTDLVTGLGRLAMAGLTRRARPADAELANLADRVADDCAARFDLAAVGGRAAVDRMVRDLAARQDVDADAPTLALATLVCGCLLRAGHEHWEDHLDLLVGVLRRHHSEPAG